MVDRKLCEYVMELRDALGLQAWTIIFSDDKPQESAYADVSCTYGRNVAVIRFCPEFLSLSKEEVREYVTHELIHVLTSRLDDCVSDLSEQLSKAVASLFASSYDRESEIITDALARIIAQAMPLPSWGARK